MTIINLCDAAELRRRTGYFSCWPPVGSGASILVADTPFGRAVVQHSQSGYSSRQWLGPVELRYYRREALRLAEVHDVPILVEVDALMERGKAYVATVLRLQDVATVQASEGRCSLDVREYLLPAEIALHHRGGIVRFGQIEWIERKS